MSAVLKVGRSAESVEPANVGIERVTVAEVVISHEKLILLVDSPVASEVCPLGVLHLRGGAEVGCANPETFKSCLICGGDGVAGGVGALKMLVGNEEEDLVFENWTADVADEIIHMQAGLDDAAGHIRDRSC